MKLRPGLSLLLIIALLTAVVAGWLFDTDATTSQGSSLEIPDNIDSYMHGVKLTVYKPSGKTSYRMNSPYLEHYVLEDSSYINQPDIDYHSDVDNWHLNSDSAILAHKSNILTLIDQVKVNRAGASGPMTLDTSLLILLTDEERAQIPQPLQLRESRLDLQAQSADLDMKKQFHQFHRVKAVYQPKQNS